MSLLTVVVNVLEMATLVLVPGVMVTDFDSGAE
jgi:hypothetical protein